MVTTKGEPIRVHPQWIEGWRNSPMPGQKGAVDVVDGPEPVPDETIDQWEARVAAYEAHRGSHGPEGPAYLLPHLDGRPAPPAPADVDPAAEREREEKDQRNFRDRQRRARRYAERLARGERPRGFRPRP